MTRITPINPSAATGKAATLLEKVRGALGIVPNLMANLAHSPAALEGYLSLSGALRGGTLGGRVGEQIALAVAERNGCDYCLAAHTLLGGKAGLNPADVESARRGTAADPKAAAAVALATAVLRTKGNVPDADVAAARAAGLTDGELAEVVAHVALNVLTNFFNNLAGTPIDFPPAAPLAPAA
ncbi:MAG TPA: carboxymuconolactone decarboxylase family protein [Humisphaera sp.]